jgi:hypothetical protein
MVPTILGIERVKKEDQQQQEWVRFIEKTLRQ